MHGLEEVVVRREGVRVAVQLEGPERHTDMTAAAAAAAELVGPTCSQVRPAQRSWGTGWWVQLVGAVAVAASQQPEQLVDFSMRQGAK